MRAFIVRPFGTKVDLSGRPIDFDRVERELIDPALSRLGITGRTTAEISEAGNIREDMFQLLVTADLVVADISIHNANVFYELGVRHALRDKWTFLLRCDGDEIPFDLRTDRYLVYNREHPGVGLDTFAEALRRTRDSDRRDSPVFALLPELEAQDPGRFLVVPADFREDVEKAAAGRLCGDLRLYATEVRGLPWEREGLRILGRTQLDIRAYEGAKDTWEFLRTIDPDNVEASLLLATIYERLGDLTLSDLATRRVLARRDLARRDRAEALALLARNAKKRWKAEWFDIPASDDRRAQALRSGHLRDCFEAYEKAYEQDLNEFYPGLNAVGMVTILVRLAEALPEIWGEPFDDPAEALNELGELRNRLDRLARGVELSIQAARSRLELSGRSDIWLEISRADLSCLTAKRAARVDRAYRDALVNAQDFHRDAAGNQLAIYEALEVLTDNVQAALKIVGSRGKPPEAANRTRVLLFTGHRIDEPGRGEARFPANKEAAARRAIREKLEEELALAGGKAIGLAGGACGGDLLFHEICSHELNIPTQLYLALPRALYVESSVQSAGPRWVERFNRLLERLQPRVMSDSEDLPRWLRDRPGYEIWQRANLCMVHNAIELGGSDVTLIALWDGRTGDGPGGTDYIVRQARKRGIKVVTLDPHSLPEGPA